MDVGHDIEARPATVVGVDRAGTTTACHPDDRRCRSAAIIAS